MRLAPSSLPFFVNAWKENGLSVDGVCDDPEGCNMLSYRRMKDPKRGAVNPLAPELFFFFLILAHSVYKM